MADGAHLGIGPESAMKAIVGGEQPAEKPMDPIEMQAWITSASKADATSYDGMARYAAKLVLDFLLEDPRRASIPTERSYSRRDDGTTDYSTVAVPDLYDRMKEHGIDLEPLGLTGFMWGWAVNAARRCVELPPVANPAIVDI